MMNCKHVRHLLDSYVEGELSAAQKVEVLAHLTNCADCERAVQQLRALASALTRKPEVEPSSDFSARVRERLVREGLVVATPRVPSRWVLLEAATIALFAALSCLALCFTSASLFGHLSSAPSFFSQSGQNVVAFFQSLTGGLTAFTENTLDSFQVARFVGEFRMQALIWIGLTVAIVWNLWIHWQGGQIRSRMLAGGDS